MQEMEYIEKLKAFAQSTARSVDYDQKAYPKSGINTFQKYKTHIAMPSTNDPEVVFVWFRDPFGNVGYSNVLCGVFIALPLLYSKKLSIRNKDFTDRLKYFFREKPPKIGDHHFDSRFIIEGKPGTEEMKLLSNSVLQREIHKAMEIGGVTEVSLNGFHPEFIAAFEAKSVLGVLNTCTWNIEDQFIESLFYCGEKLKKAVDNL